MTTSAPPASYAPGDDVDVFSFGKWYRGAVLKMGRTRATVRYTTSGATRDKAFALNLVRPHAPDAFDFTPTSGT